VQSQRFLLSLSPSCCGNVFQYPDPPLFTVLAISPFICFCQLHARPVNVRHAFRDFGEQLGRIEPPEGLFGDQQGLPDDRRRVLDSFESLGSRGPQPDGGERRLDRIRRP
jgi:hypothetical protein